MWNLQILQTAVAASAPTQGQTSLTNRIGLFDVEVPIRGLSVEGLPGSDSLVDGSEEVGEVLKVMAVAELTAAHGGRFRKQVGAVLNGHNVIEVDLSQTTTIDCAGLGALVAIRNLTPDRNGVVRLVNPTAQVRQLLDLMRAGEIFEIVKASN